MGSVQRPGSQDQINTEIINRKVRPKFTLFGKEGQSNIVYRGIKSKRRRYMKDIYITMLDIRWRWAFVILFSGFAVSSVLFSFIYFLMSLIHGDFDHIGDPRHTPCITGLTGYMDALLFSLETQSTIGYGAMYPQGQCSATIPVIFIQVTFGFLLETMLLGFIFMKVARPKHRRHTLIFSQNACVCLQDQQLTLQIRVGDIRNTHLIDAHLYGILVKRYVTRENYVYPLFQHEIEFNVHGMTDRLFMFYPLVVSHKITSDSPLYSLTPEDLTRETFELLVILEGTIESTGEMVQAKTSISNMDVRWGYRFAQTEEYDEANKKWCVNFSNFNEIFASETPRCSARDLIAQSSISTQTEFSVLATAL